LENLATFYFAQLKTLKFLCKYEYIINIQFHVSSVVNNNDF